MVRWEWDMGCDVCGLCICLQAKSDAKPFVVCEIDQRVLAVRARRETPLMENGQPFPKGAGVKRHG